MELNTLREASQRHTGLIMPPYDIMVTADGFDAVCAFTSHYRGCQIYVPDLRKIFNGCIEAAVREDYDGSNVVELSRKYGFSCKHIRSLV